MVSHRTVVSHAGLLVSGGGMFKARYHAGTLLAASASNRFRRWADFTALMRAKT